MGEARLQIIEECAAVADHWLDLFGDFAPEHLSAREWATSAVKDIAEEIRKLGAPPTPTPAE
jgi:hypothetical protein